MTKLEWKEYFETNKGTGYFASSDTQGKVDIAVYSRPHIQEDGKWVFIIAKHRTMENLQSNPHAAYAFTTGSLQGFRFYLILEELLGEGDIFNKVLSESRKPKSLGDEKNSLIGIFNLNETRPLVGD